MKVRLDFVTNSSTSCYICEVCGEVAAGRDISLRDWGMSQCAKEHVFCEAHMVGEFTDELKKDLLLRDKYIDDEVKRVLRDLDGEGLRVYLENAEEVQDTLAEFDYEGPSELCPICSLTHVRDKDMLDYVLRKVFTKKDVVAVRIQKRFVSLEALREWCDED